MPFRSNKNLNWVGSNLWFATFVWCLETLWQFLYVPVSWKQWLLPTEAAQLVYWLHNGNGRAKSSDMHRYTLLLWRQYTNCCLSREKWLFSSYWDIQELKDIVVLCIYYSNMEVGETLPLAVSIQTQGVTPVKEDFGHQGRL